MKYSLLINSMNMPELFSKKITIITQISKLCYGVYSQLYKKTETI